ncbi:3'-5' exonuclease [Microbacterium sp. EYE_5]|uniref:exonuclease domain-containing protein n=1 Tax=unclassified Microbacterium TaxID=2609290 RepID=UPI0020041D12|nr:MULTISPECIES: exonuclease domain-containing protein [unclassified Microbacterium]MCK6080529.1 3'-5' exonuclease [Microbacterium sp. EYE_382]MCK6085800.1 3'-5' exonuclease [Microbacterium sp. EYE_384]MCK6124702.1 3'-5' exonuclease [Microbacterium sp. EYE_80]MCK6127611.1 3'-5' exonuclease [Microbacterium sp. EYE_79]MCK6141484.1 3'-5' exonuclease [Microbacterium sp. EYE_39]
MGAWQEVPLWDDDTWNDLGAQGSTPAVVPPEPIVLVVAEPAPAVIPAVVSAGPCTGPLGVFDLETTGVDVRSDRIVTAHVGVLDASGAVIDARTWLADPGVEIPDGATAVHGITTERARAEGRPAAEVVAEVTATLRDLFAAGIPVVAYNAPFDFSLLKYEGIRHGVEPIAAPSPVIDPLVVDKTYDRYRRGKRTLEVVAAHYAVPLEGAHDAAADAIAAGRVAQAIAARFTLELSADELHAQQIGWARAQAESLGAYFVRIGRLDAEVDGSWPIR